VLKLFLFAERDLGTLIISDSKNQERRYLRKRGKKVYALAAADYSASIPHIIYLLLATFGAKYNKREIEQATREEISQPAAPFLWPARVVNQLHRSLLQTLSRILISSLSLHVSLD